MQNLKKYLIIAGVLLIASAFITSNVLIKKNKFLKLEVQRVQRNNLQLMTEKRTETNLYLRQKEITGKLLTERDSLAKRLEIRPKQIEKIVYQVVTVRDTVNVPVPVVIAGQNFWKVTDTGKCFTWKADVFLRDDSLKVNRTEFNYHNKTTDVFFRKRPHKFLFIKYGKWVNLHEFSSECGETKQEIFNFIK